LAGDRGEIRPAQFDLDSCASQVCFAKPAADLIGEAAQDGMELFAVCEIAGEGDLIADRFDVVF